MEDVPLVPPSFYIYVVRWFTVEDSCNYNLATYNLGSLCLSKQELAID